MDATTIVRGRIVGEEALSSGVSTGPGLAGANAGRDSLGWQAVCGPGSADKGLRAAPCALPVGGRHEAKCRSP
jgi:hypothetical protein